MPGLAKRRPAETLPRGCPVFRTLRAGNLQQRFAIAPEVPAGAQRPSGAVRGWFRGAGYSKSPWWCPPASPACRGTWWDAIGTRVRKRPHRPGAKRLATGSSPGSNACGHRRSGAARPVLVDEAESNRDRCLMRHLSMSCRTIHHVHGQVRCQGRARGYSDRLAPSSDRSRMRCRRSLRVKMPTRSPWASTTRSRPTPAWTM